MTEARMTEKERLMAALAGEEVDRPPFVGPGGMMTVALTEVMDAVGCYWPEAHGDPGAMAELGGAMHDLAGIENVGVPFCLTVEAEALGAPVNLGSKNTEPRITGYVAQGVGDFRSLGRTAIRRDGRAQAVLEAIERLAGSTGDTPVIGNLTGPISLATSLVDPLLFFKALRTDGAAVHDLLGFIVESLIDFGRAQLEAGADVLVIADPTGTGEILGPAMFREFALPYINRIVSGLGQDAGRQTIVHICGRVQSIFKELSELEAAGLSVDSLVSIAALKEHVGGKILVGNVSTQLLDNGPRERIITAGLRCLQNGVGILAPACGISPNTRLDHLQALASVVKSDASNEALASVVKSDGER